MTGWTFSTGYRIRIFGLNIWQIRFRYRILPLDCILVDVATPVSHAFTYCPYISGSVSCCEFKWMWVSRPSVGQSTLVGVANKRQSSLQSVPLCISWLPHLLWSQVDMGISTVRRSVYWVWPTPISLSIEPVPLHASGFKVS